MKILLGITAGVSLYKTIPVIRSLVKSGHSVRVILTENAKKLVSPLLFQVVSENPVADADFSREDPLAHIRLGDWADKMAVIPASANTIAKIANGIADNLLTSTVLACDKKKILFPAMNVKMYENPVTQDNISKLRARGFEIVEPAYGDLACGYQGRGRLPAEDALIGILERETTAPLSGKKYVVTAGGTSEPLDPVRHLSNQSSGKMGIEIAKALDRLGAGVVLVAGNVTAAIPSHISCVRVRTTRDMLEAVRKNLPGSDGLFMAAAPADFRPENFSGQKIKKDKTLSVSLVRNPDILAEIRSQFPDHFLVGFALETEDGESRAGAKLREKGLNYIVLNSITPDFNPLENDLNTVVLITPDGTVGRKKDLPKKEVARWIVEETLLSDRK